MYYPHFFYDPSGPAYLQIDTVQQLSRVNLCASSAYTQSSTGLQKQISSKRLSSGSFECTWYSSNHDVEWYLDYLTGRDIIFAYGPRDMASYVNIQNVRIMDSPGNTLKISIDVTFLGQSRGHFRDASDPRCVGGVIVADGSATLDAAAKLDAQWQMRQFSIQGNGVILPAGNYRMFARIKDTTHAANDIYMVTYAASSVNIGSASKTVTSNYAIYTVDVTLPASYVNSTIVMQVRKATTTANNIYVDCLGIVAIP
jgi:hypothetical protein